jgi:hypothetical protein
MIKIKDRICVLLHSIRRFATIASRVLPLVKLNDCEVRAKRPHMEICVGCALSPADSGYKK